MNAIAKTDRPQRPIDVLRRQLASIPEIAQNLPSTVSPDKFRNVVITAANMNEDLLKADRKSLIGACVKCAADGLVPDNREAALVLFNGKVQYMPMIGGLLKRARNSGEIASIVVQVVHERDTFVWRPSDAEQPVTHEVPGLAEDRGAPIGAYAICRLKDGSVMAEVMSKAEIEKVRNVSRSKGNGPWVLWWEQMARKSVFRRLSKYLPMDAAPPDAIFARDDSLGKADGDADAAPAYIDGEAEVMPSKLDMLDAAPDDGFPGVVTPRDEVVA